MSGQRGVRACGRVQKGFLLLLRPSFGRELRSCAAERIYLAWPREIGQLGGLTELFLFSLAAAGFGIFFIVIIDIWCALWVTG